MKYNFLIIFFLFVSCTQNYSQSKLKKTYNSKGFAYIYNDEDYEKKIIKNKLNSSEAQIAHNKLRPGTLIRLINLKSKESIVLKNSKKINYSDFYKIVITKPVAQLINLNDNLPLVEVIEIKKNKSFIAKKTKIFNEEKKIHSNAPITKVQIDNISKSKNVEKKILSDKLYIIIANFYSRDSARLLKKRITDEIKNFSHKKLHVKSKKLNEISLLSGPYSSINLMKNDYIQLKNFGFEELEISINE